MEKQCSCSNEPQGTIPVARVIQKLDSFFAVDDMQGAGRILRYWESEASVLNDIKGLISILNEEVGYYRKTNDKENGLKAVDELLSLLSCRGEHDVSTATMYLNCATTMRAFSKTNDALDYYLKAKEIYEQNLEKDDYLFASFYNNYGTALADLNMFESARESYQKAIDILKSKGGYGELAVTYINFAHLVDDEARASGCACDDEIERLLDLAYECLNDAEITRDANYAYICTKCAPTYAYFGYFLQKSDLEQRARDIYNSNKK